MLNAPVWHPAFSRQTPMPSGTISIDHDASLTFEFVDVEPIPTSIPTGTIEDIRDVLIVAASDMPATVAEPEVLRSVGVSVSPRADTCLDITPDGPGHMAVVSIPAGSALRVTPGAPGGMSVYLEVDGGFSQDQSLGLEVTPDPLEIGLPSAIEGEVSVLRLHPPASGTTTLCLVPPT